MRQTFTRTPFISASEALSFELFSFRTPMRSTPITAAAETHFLIRFSFEEVEPSDGLDRYFRNVLIGNKNDVDTT